MFALVGQVERGVPRPRGLPGGRPGRDDRRPRELGGRARRPGATPGGRWPRRSARRSAGGPGPVLLAFPEDVLDEQMPAGARSPTSSAAARPVRTPTWSARSIQLPGRGRRPLILAGARRPAAARSTATWSASPSSSRCRSSRGWRRADVFPNDHPLYLGMTGLRPRRDSSRARLADADELLVIGCRLNEPTSMDYAIPSDGQRWTHVDIEPRAARAGLRAAGPRDPGRRPDVPRGRRPAPGRRPCTTRTPSTPGGPPTAADRAAWEAATVVDGGDWDGPGVHPGRIVATMRRVLPAEAIVATDAGNFAGWLARGYRFRDRARSSARRPARWATRLPAAIAAALVHHERPVVGVTGDGGFGDDDGGARDGRPRALPDRRSSSSTTVATARSTCTRARAGPAWASRPSSARSTS